MCLSLTLCEHRISAFPGGGGRTYDRYAPHIQAVPDKLQLVADPQFTDAGELNPFSSSRFTVLMRLPI